MDCEVITMKLTTSKKPDILSSFPAFLGICLFFLILFFLYSNCYGLEPNEARKILPSIDAKISAVADIKIRNIVIVSNREPNAWIYPNRTIVITEALCRLVETENELAFIIAHEVAHAKIHSREEFIIFNVMNSFATGFAGELRREIEADRASVDYMKKSGFDPSPAISMMRKMPRSSNFYIRMEGIKQYIADSQRENGYMDKERNK